MRVLVSTTLYPTGDEAPTEKLPFAIRDLIEGAVTSGLRVGAVVRFLSAVDRHGINWPGIKLVGGLPIMTCPRVGVRHIYSSYLTRRLFQYVGASSDSVRAWSPDVIVCHSAIDFFYSWPVLRILTPVWVYVVHGSDFHHPEALKFASLTAQRVVARSQALAVNFQKRTGRAVDGIVFSGVKLPASVSLDERPSEELRILSACKLVGLKNLDCVIEAVAIIATEYPSLKIHFDIYGSGPLEQELRELSETLRISDRVVFHGHVEQERLFQAMRSAHLFCMPSAPETFGLAFLEAMSNGCVVIGHEGWGIDGIVQDCHNGFLVSAASGELIAEKIRHFISDDGGILRRSFETVQKYTKESAARNYRDEVIRAVPEARRNLRPTPIDAS